MRGDARGGCCVGPAALPWTTQPRRAQVALPVQDACCGPREAERIGRAYGLAGAEREVVRALSVDAALQTSPCAPVWKRRTYAENHIVAALLLKLGHMRDRA